MSLSSYLKNSYFAYGPQFGKDKAQVLALRKIQKKLKQKGGQFFDPVQKKLSPAFGDVFREFSDCLERIGRVYSGNINGSDAEYYSFQVHLCRSILHENELLLEDFDFETIRKNTIAAEKGDSINVFDMTIQKNMKALKSTKFKIIRRSLETNRILADLTMFNTANVNNLFSNPKKKNLAKVASSELINSFKDLIYITAVLNLDEKGWLVKALFEAHEYKNLEESYSSVELTEDLVLLSRIVDGPLNPIFLADVIRLTLQDLSPEFRQAESQSDFPNNILQPLLDKYKVSRQKFIQLKTDEKLQNRKKILFGDMQLLTVEVYTSHNSALFHSSKLPPFTYVEPMKIIKSFFQYFWSNLVVTTLQEIQLEGEFMDKKSQNQLQEGLETMFEIQERMVKFEEDISVPAFSTIHPFIVAAKNGLINGSIKLKAQDAINGVNERVDELIQDTFQGSTQLNVICNLLLVDLGSKTPTILSNALFLNNQKRELCLSLEEATLKLKQFIHLLNMFAINMSELKQKVVEE